MDLEQYQRDLDTDEISVTSTVYDDAEDLYDAEAIISHRVDDGGQDRYLIKWENYSIHDCTWEPLENFVNTNLMHVWTNKRINMDDGDFNAMVTRNRENFEKSLELSKAAKAKRHEKRVKKRRSLALARAKNNKPQVLSDSDDDMPLRLRRQTQSNGTALKSQEQSREQSTLFVPARPEPKTQKVPVEESSSEYTSDDASVMSQDSLCEDLKLGKVDARSNERRQQDMNGRSKRRAPLLLTSDKTKKPQSTTALPNSLPSQNQAKAGPSTSATLLKIKEPQGTRINIQPTTATASVGVASKAAPTIGRRPSTVLQLPTKAIRSSTASTAKPLAPIKIVNRPKAASKEGNVTDKQFYTTLQSRNNAEKRGRVEGIPDPTALEFINGDPRGRPSLKAPDTRPPAAINNPYGRRESDLRHKEAETEDFLPPARVAPELQSYEVGKIPLTCYDWRDGNNCSFSAQDCRFMHRDKDPATRRDYKVSSWQGRVPPKYMVPPQTCQFWLRNDKGCVNSADDCKYAHENTGLLGSLTGTAPEKIDRNESPRSRTHLRAQTCFFWNERKCKNSEGACQFLHQYTGHVANPPANWVHAPGWQPHLRDKPASLLSLSPLAHTGTPQQYQPDQPDLDAPPQPAHDDDIAGAPVMDDYPQTVLFSPIERSSDVAPQLRSSVLVKQKIEAVCKLDFEDMFACGSSDSASATLQRRAFLIFHPEDHVEELEMITRWLLIYHVEVFSFWSDGAWDQFRKETCDGKTGVIIAHPEFALYGEIPRFGEVLRENVRLWQIGYQEAYDYDPGMSNHPPDYNYDRIEIFPHGGMIYITDDVFERKPQLALKIIKLFFAKIEKCRQVTGPVDEWKRVDDGHLLWRLGVRPELMQAIYDRVNEDDKHVNADNPDHVSRIRLYELLSETGYIEQDEAPITQRPDDYFPIISERRCYMDDYYFTASLTDNQPQQFANTKMVEYFGGMMIDQRQYYRQYFIVHPEPDSVVARDWKNRIGIVDEVISPEKCISHLEEEGKGSRFEFYEWAFPEKSRVDSAAA